MPEMRLIKSFLTEGAVWAHQVQWLLSGIFPVTTAQPCSLPWLFTSQVLVTMGKNYPQAMLRCPMRPVQEKILLKSRQPQWDAGSAWPMWPVRAQSLRLHNILILVAFSSTKDEDGEFPMERAWELLPGLLTNTTSKDCTKFGSHIAPSTPVSPNACCRGNWQYQAWHNPLVISSVLLGKSLPPE